MRTNGNQYILSFKNKKEYEVENWACNSCERMIDTNSHILWCESYKELREEKDLKCNKDLANYLQKVMAIREKLKIER